MLRITGPNFFFSSSVTLTLNPDSSAKHFAGFGGQALKLTGMSGETIGQLISRFNKYRSPDQQLKTVFHQDGTPVSNTYVLNTSLVVIVKDTSF